MRLRVDPKVEYAELGTHTVPAGDSAQVEAVTNRFLARVTRFVAASY